MIVKDLIKLLQTYNETAEVLMWIECAYNGVECSAIKKIEYDINDNTITLADESLP